jgi:integrase
MNRGEQGFVVCGGLTGGKAQQLSPRALPANHNFTTCVDAHKVKHCLAYRTKLIYGRCRNLKVGDIDSRRMVVHIHGGRGNRDRDVMLSPKLLEALRDYWRGLRRSPTEWLFPGNAWHTSSRPVTTKVFWTTCQSAPEHKPPPPRRLPSSRCI